VADNTIPLLILLVGLLVVLAILTKAGLERIRVPSLIGYLVLGFLLRVADLEWEFLSPGVREGFDFLAKIGLVTLLFRVGLESDLAGLVREFPRAALVWVGDVTLSGSLAYLAASELLGLPLIPSLFVGVAFSATSVAVSITPWREANALRTHTGELVLDVAELDDISGITLMAMLFAVVPILKGGLEASLLPALGRSAGLLLAEAVGFGALCVFFSRYIEQPMTSFFERIEPPPDPMLMVAGTGFIIAALARWMGFSLAIGALFAGLVFSRDPEAVKLDASFGTLDELFTPFFFIGVGLNVEPAALHSALGISGLLLAAAVAGKLLGAGTPGLLVRGWTGGSLIGVSMVPRAEIAMVIMEHGRSLGAWAVPPHVYAAAVVVSALTCILSPLALRFLLGRWPQAAARR
jgi:Kef-type K+ transport system membrane component KefB